MQASDNPDKGEEMRIFRCTGLATLVVISSLAACGGDDGADPDPTVEEVPDCKSTNKIATTFNFDADDVTEKPSIGDFACEYNVATEASQDPIEVTWFIPTDTSELGPVWKRLDEIDARCSDEPCEVQNSVGLITTKSERTGNTQTAVDTQFDSRGQVQYVKVYTTTRAGTMDCTTWIMLPYHEPNLDRYKQGTVSLTQEACGV